MAKTFVKQVKEELQRRLNKATVTTRVFTPAGNSYATKVLYVTVTTDDDVIKVRLPLVQPTGATDSASTKVYVQKLVSDILYSYFNQINFRNQQQSQLHDP